MAKDYQKEIDFAFFVVNFGYSKSDYEMLTPCEKAFVYKAWENKAVSDSTMFRDAALNAISNAFRKKNKRFIRLWKKKQKKANKDVIKENLHVIEEAEKKNLLYLHFTMDDNLSLSEKIKARYKAMYTGVFYNRYILG